MSAEQIKSSLNDMKYNALPEGVCEKIISDVNTETWQNAHHINEEIYAYNNTPFVSGLKTAYWDKDDFYGYPNPGAFYDIMTYITNAVRGGKGTGSYKIYRIFTSELLRAFVEMAIMVGMPSDSIRRHLSGLDPNLGVWSQTVVMTYSRIFWDATRLSLKTKNVRHCDIREYFMLNCKNPFYEPYMVHLGSTEDDILAYYGLASFSTLVRKNKSIHGKIASQIMEYFDNKTKKILPTDYIKLYMHLDAQIADQESKDRGAEVYREEIERIFKRLAYVSENYPNMDQLVNLPANKDSDIPVDDPYIKEENK